MSSTEKLLKCIVCLNFLDFSVKNICSKGHIHCQACADTLEGTCGLCDLPLQPVEQKTAEKLNTENTTNENQTTKTENHVRESDEDATISEVTKKLDSLSSIDFSQTKEDSQSNDTLAVATPIAIESLHSDLEISMQETLQSLHKFVCPRICETFEDCIQDLLQGMIDETATDTAVCLNTGIEGTGSITDLLETLHVRLCPQNCDCIEMCLSQQLKTLIKYDESENELALESETNKQAQAGSNDYVNEYANVVHAFFKPSSEGKKPMPQFEFINTYPKHFETHKTKLAVLAEDKKQKTNFFENVQTACPLPNCNTEFDVSQVLSHLEEKHKNLKIEGILPGECKTFFIDPSILEPHEVDCLLCYFMVEANSTLEGLPILLLVCRTSLRKLYDMPERSTAQTVESQSVVVDTESELNIDVAIYGSNSKLKRKPVFWSNEDVLIIWPIAPIAQNAPLKTVLSVFVHNKPTCHRSISFHMRSIQESREPANIFGAVDALTLTNVEIDALTSGGQHAIHCQFMCNSDKNFEKKVE